MRKTDMTTLFGYEEALSRFTSFFSGRARRSEEDGFVKLIDDAIKAYVEATSNMSVHCEAVGAIRVLMDTTHDEFECDPDGYREQEEEARKYISLEAVLSAPARLRHFRGALADFDTIEDLLRSALAEVEDLIEKFERAVGEDDTELEVGRMVCRPTEARGKLSEVESDISELINTVEDLPSSMLDLRTADAVSHWYKSLYATYLRCQKRAARGGYALIFEGGDPRSHILERVISKIADPSGKTRIFEAVFQILYEKYQEFLRSPLKDIYKAALASNFAVELSSLWSVQILNGTEVVYESCVESVPDVKPMDFAELMINAMRVVDVREGQ